MNNFIELIESNLSYKEGLEFIEQEIKLLISFIAQTNQIDDAELFFKNLEDIQFVLAKSVFKNGIVVSSFLRDFVYNYDRIDDKEYMECLYLQIKQDKYV